MRPVSLGSARPPVPTPPAAPGRPAPPVSGPLGPTASQKIEIQRLELKGERGAAPVAATPPAIPPRPTNPPPAAAPRPTSPTGRSGETPPQDVSGVVPRGWPPPRVTSRTDEEAPPRPAERPPEERPAAAVRDAGESGGRYLPGPETPAAMSRGRVDPGRPASARPPLGPPPELDEPAGRGPLESDSQASWGAGGGRARSAAAPVGPTANSKKGPVLLVSAFAAVLIGVLLFPSGKSPVAAHTPMASASEGPPGLIGQAGGASATPSLAPSDSESPADEPDRPVRNMRPSASPSVAPVAAAATPKPAVTPTVAAVSTPLPSLTPSVSPSPAETPVADKPTPKPKPKPVEEPPARAEEAFNVVHVFVKPASLQSNVSLAGPDKIFEQGAGDIRLQPDKKGTYKLKVSANGYQTYTKTLKVDGTHNIQVTMERNPAPPPPVEYHEPAPAAQPYQAPAQQYQAPAPAYYPPAPSGGGHQIQAPGI